METKVTKKYKIHKQSQRLILYFIKKERFRILVA